jgi:hypothetical protein
LQNEEILIKIIEDNYLKNRSTVREKPITEVVSKTKKKKRIHGHNEVAKFFHKKGGFEL